MSANPPSKANTLIDRLKSVTVMGWVAISIAVIGLPWSVVSGVTAIIQTITTSRADDRAAEEQCFEHQVSLMICLYVVPLVTEQQDLKWVQSKPLCRKMKADGKYERMELVKRASNAFAQPIPEDDWGVLGAFVGGFFYTMVVMIICGFPTILSFHW